MIVLWGEEYEEACEAFGPRTHADLYGARLELALTPTLGERVIEGGDLYSYEVSEVMALFRARLLYTIEHGYVILWGVEPIED